MIILQLDKIKFDINLVSYINILIEIVILEINFTSFIYRSINLKYISLSGFCELIKKQLPITPGVACSSTTASMLGFRRQGMIILQLDKIIWYQFILKVSYKYIYCHWLQINFTFFCKTKYKIYLSGVTRFTRYIPSL